jgi:LPXTG-site transpeptidase (sortase) family protein
MFVYFMDSLLNEVWGRRYVFLSTFFLVFTFSYIVLLALDFLPEPVATENNVEKNIDETSLNQNESSESMTEEEDKTDLIKESEVVNYGDSQSEITFEESELPLKISIAKLGRTVSILNPESRTITDLDSALLNGVVRHPDSATLSQDGNIFILGHSSYLPVVINKNFQAFNGIQNLEWGDVIEVFSSDVVYEYRVEKVYRAQAKEMTVPIADTGKLLTLATCNSFGSVDDRYVVEAKRISEQSI